MKLKTATLETVQKGEKVFRDIPSPSGKSLIARYEWEVSEVDLDAKRVTLIAPDGMEKSYDDEQFKALGFKRRSMN